MWIKKSQYLHFSNKACSVRKVLLLTQRHPLSNGRCTLSKLTGTEETVKLKDYKAEKDVLDHYSRGHLISHTMLCLYFL